MSVPSSSFRCVLLLALGSALGLASSQAAGKLDSLLTNSPFGQAKSGQPIESGNQAFEFRGVMEENGQQFFSVFETSNKRSRWLALNTTTDDMVVKSYDAENNTITLEQQGRVLSLTLKSGPRVAMVQNMAPPMPPSVLNQPAQVMPGAAGRGPEAQRLQQIAEEIRRRRALRQQAPQMPMPNANPTLPGMSGGPVPQPNSSGGTGPMPLPNTSGGQGPTPMPGTNTTLPPPNFTPNH